MADAFIYGLHAGDGRIRYVGSTSNPRRRLNEHRSPATLAKLRGRNYNPALLDWLESNPIEMTVLDEVSEDVRIERECYWTRLFSDLLNRAVGQEMLKGAESHSYGRRHTDDWKATMSAQKSGDRHHFYGKHLTEDHRAKVGRAGTSNHNSRFTEEQVKEIRDNPEGLRQVDLAARYGVTQTTISAVQRRATYKNV